MSHGRFADKAESKRDAIFNCSMAMLKAIRSYGFAATLDVVVRISNYDSIVGDLLPFLPSIASAEMLEAFYQRPGSIDRGRNPEDPATETEPLIILTGRDTRK
jgi:hypothetical protein